MEPDFFGDLERVSIQASAARGMIGETSSKLRKPELVAEHLTGIAKRKHDEMLIWDARTGKFESGIKDDRDLLSEGWAKFVAFNGWPRIELTHLNPDLWIEATSRVRGESGSEVNQYPSTLPGGRGSLELAAARGISRRPGVAVAAPRARGTGGGGIV